jgi:hypothetical protein
LASSRLSARGRWGRATAAAARVRKALVATAAGYAVPIVTRVFGA